MFIKQMTKLFYGAGADRAQSYMGCCVFVEPTEDRLRAAADHQGKLAR